MIVLLIDAEKNVFGGEEEELARLGRDGEEKCGSSLDVRGLFGADGDTLSSGEGLSGPGCGVVVGDSLVHLRKGSERRFTDFDVDILDTVCKKKNSEANSDFDATVGREGAGLDSDPDNDGSSRFINYPDADRVETRILHPLFHQVAMHDDIKPALPDVAEGVFANKT